MKTLSAKIKRLFIMIPLLVVTAGCGKSSDPNSTTTAAYVYNTTNFTWSNSVCTDLVSSTTVSSTYCNSNPFVYQNSSCYDSYSAKYVNARYCSGVTTASTSYYLSNGTCYSSGTGQAVVYAYCSSTTATLTTTGLCYGYYIYNNNGYAQIVQCYGNNCRGYTMIDYNTRVTVLCQ